MKRNGKAFQTANLFGRFFLGRDTRSTSGLGHSRPGRSSPGRCLLPRSPETDIDCDICRQRDGPRSDIPFGRLHKGGGPPNVNLPTVNRTFF